MARILRTRDEGHAASICRALSLPVEDDDTNSDQTPDQPIDQVYRPGDQRDRRTVTFKSVPAAWKSEKAKATGHCAPSPRQQAPSQASLVSIAESGSGSAASSGLLDFGAFLREDDWVGLTRALAVTLPDKKQDRSKAATSVCGACAGYGCSWCDNGVVREEEGRGGKEEGLWEAALCPT